MGILPYISLAALCVQAASTMDQPFSDIVAQRLSGVPHERYAFALLSDTHVGIPDPRLSSADSFFTDAITELRHSEIPVDFIVVAGDIIHENPQAQLPLFLKALEPLGLPLVPIAGNHDRVRGSVAPFVTGLFPELGTRAIAPHADLYYSVDKGAYQFIILDTSMPDRGPLDTAQAAWLRKKLAEKPSMVFAHAGPFRLGRELMDKYLMADRFAFLDILAAAPHPCWFFQGHLHKHKRYLFHNVHVELLASTAFSMFDQERGYTIVQVEGNSVRTFFKPLGRPMLSGGAANSYAMTDARPHIIFSGDASALFPYYEHWGAPNPFWSLAQKDSALVITVRPRPNPGGPIQVSLVTMDPLIIRKDDALEYWINISAPVSAERAGIEICTTEQYVFTGTHALKDTAGFCADPLAPKDGLAANRWMHRKIPLGTLAGQPLQRVVALIDLEKEMQAGEARILLKDVKISRSGR